MAFKGGSDSICDNANISARMAKKSVSKGGCPRTPYFIREFKQNATAGATTAAFTEKVWESTSRQSAKFSFKQSEIQSSWAKELKISFI